MTDRDSGGGGMTGATGDLTPDDAQRDFAPGELREISDPMHQADVTEAQADVKEAQADVKEAQADVKEAQAGDSESRPDREPWVGGDEKSDHEEHF